MIYNIELTDDCKKAVDKLCKKNSVLKIAIQKKISEIIENPERYKPLRNELAGEYRVHILKSFVLKFIVKKEINTVIFITFEHHDEAYRK